MAQYAIKRFSQYLEKMKSKGRVSDAKIIEENGKKVFRLGRVGKIAAGTAAVGAAALGAKKIHDKMKESK